MKLSWKLCWRVGLSIFVLYLAITFWPSVGGLMATVIGAAAPLLIGCIVAYVVNILMSAYERLYFPKSTKPGVRKTRRPLCMLAAFVSVAAIVALIAVLVVPQLVSCTKLLIAEINPAADWIIAALDKLSFVPDNFVDTLDSINWQERIRDILAGLGSVMDVVMDVVLGVFDGLVTALFALIFAIYILSGKERLGAQFQRLAHHFLPQRVYERTGYVLHILNDSFRKFIVGQCTEAVILGGLCALGMLLFRLPYATMIGALIAFTALIPIAGAYIGAALGAFMILTVSPIKALGFLVFLVILQQLEGNLVYPRVVGSSIGLPGIWVLAAVTIGGGTLGVGGMLLGVPLASALYRILRENVPPLPAPAPAAEPDTAAEAPPDTTE